MESIADLVAFCNQQIAFHSKRASYTKASEKQRESHASMAQDFTRVVLYLAKLKDAQDRPIAALEPEVTQGSADEAVALFLIDPFDLSGLPPEVLEELSISQADQQDAQIVQLLRIAKRPLSINEITVGLFRKFQQQTKRTALSSRLYRMAARGDIENVDKGVYAVAQYAPRQASLIKDDLRN